ncbi:MAG: prepilin-type N-terminal cleavage/methylation domain-containing protein [Acidimicrobiia bacterium]|nr:prepilin-type N-terminal cleavage/methylation domain-containing protein [Acidimicrobiia bacterium]
MLRKLIQRRHEGEEGFTLIELMVVVLIIAILIAIAIPTFLGARQRAQNRAAQSSLRNALTAAKTMYTDTNSYAAADESSTGLSTVEPSLTYVAHGTASTGPKIVSVHGQATQWSGAALSDSGNCYFIRDVASGTSPTPGTTFGSGSTCTADSADTNATGTSFP